MNKAALGFGFTVSCVFWALAVSFYGTNPMSEENKLLISVGLAVGGCLALAMNWRAAGERPTSQTTGDVFPLFSLRFWGVMLLAFSVLAYGAANLPKPKSKLASAKSSTGARKSVGSSEEASAAGLHLQEIIIRPGQPNLTAIVNGRTVRAGDAIGDATVVAIYRYGVKVRRAQEIQWLEIRDWAQVSVKPTPASTSASSL